MKSRRRLADVCLLEELFIGAAFFRNRDLSNFQYACNLRRLVVPGFLNDGRGKRSASARAVAELLGSTHEPVHRLRYGCKREKPR
jgi:hypothetical protein